MTATVVVRCYAELNDFLPRHRRDQDLCVPVSGHESIKNVLESLGVPHPEIAALLVNGGAVDFSYQPRPADVLAAYPMSVLPAGPLLPLRPPLTEVRFVLDAHLGRLAAYLRMLGFDTLYRNDYDDPELAQLAAQGRVLLSRDIGLLKRSQVIHGYFVRNTMPEDQLTEIVRRFRLQDAVASFQRCLRCNGLNLPVEKADVLHLLEPKTRQYYHHFYQCQACGQVYWRGSHHNRMQDVIDRTLRDARDGAG